MRSQPQLRPRSRHRRPRTHPPWAPARNLRASVDPFIDVGLQQPPWAVIWLFVHETSLRKLLYSTCSCKFCVASLFLASSRRLTHSFLRYRHLFAAIRLRSGNLETLASAEHACRRISSSSFCAVLTKRITPQIPTSASTLSVFIYPAPPIIPLPVPAGPPLDRMRTS